jgi:hypothetical protein
MSNRKLRVVTIAASMQHEARGLRARAARAGSSTVRMHKNRARKRARRAVFYLDAGGGRHRAATAARRAPRARVHRVHTIIVEHAFTIAERGGVRGALDLLKEFATKLPDLRCTGTGTCGICAARSCFAAVGNGNTCRRRTKGPVT